MARLRKSDKMYYKRSRSSLVPIFSFLLVCGAISFGIASVWHNVSGDAQMNKKRKEDQQTRAEAQAEIKEEPQENEKIQTNADEQSADNASKNNKDVTGETKQENENEKESAATSSVVVGESERVTSEYFDDAAFVGDSITQGIQVYDIMSNTTVIANTGLNPQSIMTEAKIRTQDGYVTALEALKESNPNKIYIMLGVNGIGFELDVFDSLYTDFVKAVKEQHPDSTIYVQSMLPVTSAFETGSHNPYNITNEKINKYNETILKMAEELGVYYLDVASAIKDENGALPNEASPTDGIHFGPTYYTKWFDYLKTHTA